ncbi:MAG TPA: hypothetical protein ENG40_02590 [Thermoprotei archaeon]|nr:hypothetical protein [Thermoprotei archaeon]
MNGPFKAIQLYEPKIQFFQCTPQTNPRLIHRCKPFSYEVFLNQVENINIKVITEENSEDLANKFIRNLIFGVNKSPYFGFNNIFGVNINFNPTEDIKITTSQDVGITAKELADELSYPSIIFILGSSNFISPTYPPLKAEVIGSLSKKGITLQFVKRETIENYMNKYGYEYILLNIATAVYAKCNGTPWKLAGPTLATNGLIIGISFHKRTLEDRTKIYYGSIQVLDEYGDHLYTEIRTYRFEEGETKGLYIPYRIMKRIMTGILGRFKNVPLIIVHKSAQYVEDEDAKGIREALDEVYGDEKPYYLLLHIKRNIIYRGYDPSIPDNSIKRGVLLLNQDINNKHILFTTGRTNNQRKKLGTPKPLELFIYENNSPLNGIDIAQQALALTKLDWNTTEMETRTPITLKYSRRAAQLAPYLLSEDTTNMQIGDIRDLM